ncbi:MAG: hypothetical protein DMG65_16215 [Candidatus Angelobacter sp. Gp1-AA117]|nr:MAG: hypothetical protein DMG65_16215 [Candidatus Angelobacter sp. Gp1-AA117]
MDQLSEHLSSAQIQQYGKRASSAGPETKQRVEKHLADCPSCRSRVLEFQRTQFALLPDLKMKTIPTSECLSEDEIRNLAAGLCTERIAQKLKLHASTCDRCGPLLSEYTEDFSGNFTPKEQGILNQLSSGSPTWQQQTAKEMLKQATPSPPPRWTFLWRWALIPAATAACAIIVFSIWYTQRDTPEKVGELLAQAYPEHRTTEMRWLGMAWGEPKETLGPANLNKPRPLLAAKDAIQRQTPETLGRTEWLHLQAQSEILGGTPSTRLIEDLTKATQSKPASQSLLFDLAIANFRMGEITDDRSYYLRAKAVLEEMLASFPPSSAALFDRAVVEEHLQLWNQALADLNRCLPLESDPAWSAEIQDKIRKLEGLR